MVPFPVCKTLVRERIRYISESSETELAVKPIYLSFSKPVHFTKSEIFILWDFSKKPELYQRKICFSVQA